MRVSVEQKLNVWQQDELNAPVLALNRSWTSWTPSASLGLLPRRIPLMRSTRSCRVLR